MATDFHPPRLMVSFVLAPVVANMVAAKWRRSWKRTHSRPTLFRAACQMTQKLLGRRGERLWEANADGALNAAKSRHQAPGHLKKTQREVPAWRPEDRTST